MLSEKRFRRVLPILPKCPKLSVRNWFLFFLSGKRKKWAPETGRSLHSHFLCLGRFCGFTQVKRTGRFMRNHWQIVLRCLEVYSQFNGWNCLWNDIQFTWFSCGRESRRERSPLGIRFYWALIRVFSGTDLRCERKCSGTGLQESSGTGDEYLMHISWNAWTTCYCQKNTSSIYASFIFFYLYSSVLWDQTFEVFGAWESLPPEVILYYFILLHAIPILLNH